MSLDVYLIAPEPRRRSGTGVFVRESGKTVELSPAEVALRVPDAAPKEPQTHQGHAFAGKKVLVAHRPTLLHLAT